MIAILSDIHGNIHALDAVFDDMPTVSQVWLLGDSLGGLNYPCEVLDKLLNLDIPVHSILGNHERFLLDERNGKHPDWRLGTQWGTMTWSSDKLKCYHWKYLEGLSHTLSIDGVPRGAFLFHGLPDNIKGWLLTSEEANKIAEERSEIVIAHGHSHQIRMFKLGKQFTINPGSVGNALDGVGGVASYALIDEEKVNLVDNISFRSITYDVTRAVDSLLKSELMECAPGITRAVALELEHGRFFMMSLVLFALSCAEKQLGYKPDIIPPEIWHEAELKWDGSEWMPGRSR
jgi:predicted phosphodiesterase